MSARLKSYRRLSGSINYLCREFKIIIAMRPTVEKIKMMLGEGVPVEVPTAGFHFPELLELTQAAGNMETELTLVGLKNVDSKEYAQLRYAAKGKLRVRFVD